MATWFTIGAKPAFCHTNDRKYACAIYLPLLNHSLAFQATLTVRPIVYEASTRQAWHSWLRTVDYFFKTTKAVNCLRQALAPYAAVKLDALATMVASKR